MKKSLLLFAFCFMSCGLFAQVIKPDKIITPDGPNTQLYWNSKFKTAIMPHFSLSHHPASQDTTGDFFLNTDGGDYRVYVKGPDGTRRALANYEDIASAGGVLHVNDSTSFPGYVTNWALKDSLKNSIILFSRQFKYAADSSIVLRLDTIRTGLAYNITLDPVNNTLRKDTFTYLRKYGGFNAYGTDIFEHAQSSFSAVSGNDLINKTYFNANASPILTYQDGIINVSGVVKIGGALTSTRTIDNSNADLIISGNSGYVNSQLAIDPGSTTWLFTQLSNNWNSQSSIGPTAITFFLKKSLFGAETGLSISPNAGQFQILDDINHVGLQEAGDYSANYTDRNYISKGFADATYQPVGSYLTSYTETDPLVPAYSKGLTAFSVIQASTDPLYRPITYVPAFSDITSKPTTLSGYGITDAYPLSGNPSSFLTSINSSQVTTALGFTPYNATNPSGYVADLSTFTTTNLSEGSNKYYTDARVILAPLTGYSSGAGTVSSADGVLTAFQKINGNEVADAGNITTNTTNIATHTTSLQNVRKRLGTVFSITPTSSGAYTKTGSTTTWTFTGGGLTMAGGGAFTDYQIYNSYYTDASNNINQITGTVTSAGTGPGVGLVGASGSFRARINTSTGTLYIETLYGGSVYTRATSAGTISVSTSDNLTLTLTRSYLYYYAVCKDNTTGAIVSTSCTDTFAYGAIPFGGFSVSNPMVSNDGGTFVITNHNYYLNEWVQPAAVVYGNSIAEGFNSGGLSWPYILGQYSNDGGVVLDAGGSNRTDFYPNLETEIFSLKPKMLIYADGINNIIAGTSLATIESNITTMIQNATAQGIPVVLCTVAPVSSTYGGGSNATYQANIVTLNTWITGRTNCIVSDVWTKLNLAGVLNPIYDCGDGLHGNAAYHRAVAAQLVSDIGQYLRGNSSQVLLGPTYIVSTTNPQLNINYDPSHSTTIGTDASGNTIITPSGGNIENIGNIITNTTGTTGNLYVTQSGQIVADQTLSNWLLPNVSHVQFRVAVGANNTATVLTANDSYFTQEIANTTFSTSAGASTHLYAGSLAVLPPTITSNVGTVTNAPTLFITGQASANATNYYNVLSYAPGAGKNNAWFKYGVTEVSGLKADSTSTLTGAVSLGSTINKITLTQPATGSTFTLADGKTFTVNNTITLSGTDGQTYTLPSTSATIARTDAGQTFTGNETFSNTITGGSFTATTGNAFYSSGTFAASDFASRSTDATGETTAGVEINGQQTYSSVLMNGGSAATPGANMPYTNVIIGNSRAITLPSSGTTFEVSQLHIKTLPTPTNGSAIPLSLAANLVVDAAPSGATLNLSAEFLGNIRYDIGSDATADIDYRASNGSRTRLAIGADGTVLKVVSGLPSWQPQLQYSHSIFTPTTGQTVTTVNNQYNIINPAGTLATLTVALPSSPANNDVVYIKYTQAITAVTYSGGTVNDAVTTPSLGSLVVLTYDSGAAVWY